MNTHEAVVAEPEASEPIPDNLPNATTDRLEPVAPGLLERHHILTGTAIAVVGLAIAVQGARMRSPEIVNGGLATLGAGTAVAGTTLERA